MPKHDFSELLSHYPNLIAEMADTFTSHQFILELAQRHQRLYIEALYAYRDSHHRGVSDPFRVVHRLLSGSLSDFPHLVERCGDDPASRDIFGDKQKCARWRKAHRV